MRIIHTSDWHLGKYLDGIKNSRLEEQKMFLEEFIDIVEKEKADMIIIAGDIYDNGNPPAKAERLFYDTLKKLSNDGKRPIIVIAGNHDNPERLMAVSPLTSEYGIIILGTPKNYVEKGEYGSCKVLDSGESFIEIELNGERAVILALPYPSEKRLNEVFIFEDNDKERMMSYSEKIGEIFSNLSEKYREDTINLAVSHIFVNGGITSDSERSIELGGSLAVNVENLPKNAQYIALGHLHKPQRVGNTKNAYYSGSPIQYSKSEINYSKSVYKVEVTAGEEAKVEKILLRNYKPIEIWKCESVSEAIEKCKENSNRDVWVYLKIKTEEYINQEYIKLMNEYKKDIIEIIPDITSKEEEIEEIEDIREKSMGELFKEFYSNQRGYNISEELLELFLSIVNEEEEEE
ncbi:exonuclease SbcCD subunit D C-terminal domain-containing protein [Clostridium sp. MSJ-4]|uniref:Nuclease SbcCD subunit D n=1 Tax=Clostridium simiarum TaxID=2841506 RepID=A0ABS6F4H9_9CLOT|nr:exonuclease SbcCD subunit D C-terminal domain-containing protein [Clostridium simiarum]MBU5593421.1 exonuclease SbcCD subunit D C-terminal domain-containing protein [Clostridium simiarum]